MANPFLGTDAPNIASGWGHAPQLEAPSIGHLVSAILGNRLAQQKMTQENIADAIKNFQEQRQSQAYLEAAQKAGLLPEGDLGPLGVKGASLLAQEIQRKKVADSLIARRAQLGAGGGGRGRGGGGGGAGDGDVQVPEDYYGLSVAPGRHSAGPEIVEKDGVKYLVHRTSKSVTYSRVKDQGGAGTPGGGAGAADKAIREQERLLDAKSLMDAEIANERTKNAAKYPNVPQSNIPYSKSDQYNRTVNRLKQLQQMPGMPTTDAPGAIKTPSEPAPDVSTTPPLLARPDASKGAPVNLPQVGDQRPGPNGTTVEWDGHGWFVVQ